MVTGHLGVEVIAHRGHSHQPPPEWLHVGPGVTRVIAEVDALFWKWKCSISFIELFVQLCKHFNIIIGCDQLVVDVEQKSLILCRH